MATTSIWSVKGWLGKAVIYIENPKKTTNPNYYEKENMTGSEVQNLSDVIEYAAASEKTHDGSMKKLVTAINCSDGTVRDDMMRTKRKYGKENGVVCYHGYQSFAPNEGTPEIAHEIGVKLAQRLWGDKYQVLVATHLDHEDRLHNHFIVNTVSHVDGKRYYRSEKDYFNMRKVSDELCREYGLSVVEKGTQKKSKHYAQWRAERAGKPTGLSMMKADIDRAIRESMTESQFYAKLKSMGYTLKLGKDITVIPQGKERGRKLMRNFGEEYSIENIRKRILTQERPQRKQQALPHSTRYVMHGKFKHKSKITGFRALYYHYCYLLGVFPKKRSYQSVPLILREDVRKLKNTSEEARLLSKYKINTENELSGLYDSLQTKIYSLYVTRKKLRNQIRTKEVMGNPEKLSEMKDEISKLSKEITALRREVKLCENVAERSGVIKEKIEKVREERERWTEKNKSKNNRLK